MPIALRITPAYNCLITAFAKCSTSNVSLAQLQTASALNLANTDTASDVFFREEFIGSSKVLVTEQPVDVLSVSRAIAKARKQRKNSESAFMLYNLDALYDRHKLWMRELPHVEPFYAVKCNPDEVLVRTLAALGTGFDCASREEIDTVLSIGVAPEKIIFAHPCKPHSFVSHASEVGVNVMTFDSDEELNKIAANHKRPKLILRIATSDRTAKNPLSLKFGADHETIAPYLLKRAADLGIPIIGISFHVGNGCNDPSAYQLAIKHSRTLFDIGRSLGHRMEIVDIGGGYPGDDHHPTTFEKIASVICAGIDKLFPDRYNARFVGEPGRFYVMKPCSLVATVMARTIVSADRITKNPSDKSKKGFMYYMNDGIFGSFSSNVSYGEVTIGRPLFDKQGPQYPAIIWGPTCDFIDKIEDNKMMRELEVGESLIYEDMGAYTNAIATSFNGFPQAAPIYVIGERTWNSIHRN